MGLDISHDAWHGGYISFNNWRMKIAEVAGIPLPLMEGYYDFCSHILIRSDTQMYKEFLPIKWESLKEEHGGLRILLDHSDCDGEFSWEEAGLVAFLEDIMPYLILKKEQASIALTWLNKRPKPNRDKLGRMKGVPKTFIEFSKYCAKALKKAKLKRNK